MRKLSKHKIIALLLASMYLLYLVSSISSYFSLKSEKDSVLAQVNDVMKQNNDLRARINTNTKLPANTDISYYATNIYAYSLLEAITNVQLKTMDSKYGNTVSINLTFNPISEIAKFKDFVTFVSYLGYVESVTKTNMVLHVTKYSIDDAKRNLLKQGNKE